MKKRQLDSELQQDFEKIRNICLKYYDISIVDFHSKSRKREVVLSRQIAVHVLIQKYGKQYSFATYGKLINKDHATAIHCDKTINNLLLTDVKFKKVYNMLMKRFLKTVESIINDMSSVVNKSFDVRNRTVKYNREFSKELDMEIEQCLSLI